jgi:hypothetical protein
MCGKRIAIKDMMEVYQYTGNGEEDTKKRYVKDGVYNLPDDITILHIDGGRDALCDMDPIHTFMNEHPDWAYAEGYETYNGFLLSKKPELLDVKNITGSGFNYGVCAIIDNCPNRILIVAEND